MTTVAGVHLDQLRSLLNASQLLELAGSILADRKPPHVPADYSGQRYFLPGYGGLDISEKLWVPAQHVRVLRQAAYDCVGLTIRSGHFGEMNAYLDATELRSLASALLDAAHDLDTNPAASLRQQAAAGIPQPQPLDPDTEAFSAGEQQVTTR